MVNDSLLNEPTKADVAKRRFLSTRYGVALAFLLAGVVAVGTMGESAGKVIDTTGKFADRLREAPKIEVQQFALNPEDCFFQSHEQLLALADGADDALGQLSVSVAQDRNHLFRIEDPFLGFTDARGNRSRTYYSSRINSRKDLVDAITAMKGHRQVWQTQQALIALGYFDFAPRQSSEKSSKPRPAALGPQSHGEQLNALAAENGLPNGFLDRPTAAAVRLLQKESGLPETGVLDTPTLIAIAQRYPVKKSKRDTFEYDDALAGSPAAKFTVELDFRGCVALRGLGRYSDACRSPNETELVAQFDEVAAIIRGLRGNDASRATVETKLRPVFDVTVTNGSSKPDLLTHIELGFLRAEGEAGDAGAPTYAGTLESLHRYRLDVVKLQRKQDFTRTFPLEPLVPPIQISPDAPARFQIQFIGNPETPTLYSIHLRLVFARTGSVDLPIVEFSL